MLERKPFFIGALVAVKELSRSFLIYGIFDKQEQQRFSVSHFSLNLNLFKVTLNVVASFRPNFCPVLISIIWLLLQV